MLGGTPIDNMYNENVLNVTLYELPDQLKELVVTAINQLPINNRRSVYSLLVRTEIES